MGLSFAADWVFGGVLSHARWPDVGSMRCDMRCARRRLVVFGTLWLPVAMLAACGGTTAPGTGPSVPSPSPTALGPIDPALVGMWSGGLTGSFGLSAFAMNLNADASMWAEGTGNYCRFNGTWGVFTSQFSATGPDCTGTVITMVAPVSSTHLSGTWQASSGRSGTFDCTKQ